MLIMAKKTYESFAKYYDLVYGTKDYKAEGKAIERIVGKYKGSEGKKLLDVACGTGKHLKYLKQKFECTGTDLNQNMLDAAKKNLGDVRLVRSNMVTMRLGRKFDVITCLFSAIGYVKTYKNLEKTINNFSDHLNPGGVLIIQPWFNKSQWKGDGYIDMRTYDSKNLKIARLSSNSTRGTISLLNFHFLVAEKNKEVRYFLEKHELGLFDEKKTLRIMEKAGLKAKRFVKNAPELGKLGNRGLFVAVKK
jgi:ubiquinone/menaquinone biosynthesis C-methylase UbiE